MHALENLLEEAADPNCNVGAGRWPRAHTPLELAAARGAAQAAKVLLRAKADVDRGGTLSPLAAACAANDVRMVRILLTARADPNCSEPEGVTPLNIAVAQKASVPARLLLRCRADAGRFSDFDGLSPLQEAVRAPGSSMLVLLLTTGALQQERPGRSSALHAAARAGKYRKARLLVRWGASVRATDEAGRVPLQVLKRPRSFLGRKAFVRLLRP